MKRIILLIVVFAMATYVGGCDGSGSPKSVPFRPIDPDSATLWDRQTTETAELLRAIVADFNSQHKGLPFRVVQSGNYTDIYRKVMVSIQARTLPSMAVVYESMIPEYIQAGAIVPIEGFIHAPLTGLSDEEMADFFPAVIATNTFSEFGGKMYSFPYTKSVLMMYFNKRVLAEAGYSEPPRTWTEFLEQARAIKRKTGKYAWSVDVDASTIHGMIFSMGGELVQERETLFDSGASLAFFEFMETLVKEELVYQNPPRTFNDEPAFARDEIAFLFRTSSTRIHIAQAMDDQNAWGMALIPQSDPENPHTVLYGANICIFATSREQQARAWEFAKFFTQPEVSVRWALGTGYLPLRKSAVALPELQEFWAQWPYNRTAFDCLAYAKPGPNIAGWQEVRGLVEKAQTSVLTRISTGREAAQRLKREADAVLARH